MLPSGSSDNAGYAPQTRSSLQPQWLPLGSSIGSCNFSAPTINSSAPRASKVCAAGMSHDNRSNRLHQAARSVNRSRSSVSNRVFASGSLPWVARMAYQLAANPNPSCTTP